MPKKRIAKYDSSDDSSDSDVPQHKKKLSKLVVPKETTVKLSSSSASDSSDEEDGTQQRKSAVKPPAFEMKSTKPDYAADRSKERSLVRIATRGVTQLFNSVAERQKLIDDKLKEMETAKSRSKRRVIVENLKSNDFHSNLYKKLKPTSPQKEEIKTEDEEEPEDELEV
ncbi:hypothetical protein M3Y94_00197100 [Aphelenchoides besseyi]|nr:hypothetical protein M3Y94_00197100 [Aphelenchoides besseyi]KAI6236741.1 RRP15-like protein [Aphelenchoides besseyi]